MRVIIITSSSNRSGGTRQALYQAEGLTERGHEVSLCLPHDSPYWSDPPEQQRPFWVRLPEEPQRLRPVVEALLPQDPDTPTIVHAFHNKAVKRLSWWGLWWRGRHLACVAHRGVIFRPGNPLPYLSPAMRGFLVNSTACARALRFHCPAGKIHLVPNAIPDARVTPGRTAETMRQLLQLPMDGTCLLGYVGNDNPLKGADPLFRAFAGLKAPARLLVLGLTPARWQPLCVELGIADRVYLIPHDEAVCDYLQLLDAFVFPSYGMDSAPNTLLEAIRMGLPVVGSAVGGVPDMIDGNGLLVPPRQVDALRQAMTTMASEPEQRRLWGEVSQRLGQRYTVSARCELLETLYARFLKK